MNKERFKKECKDSALTHFEQFGNRTTEEKIMPINVNTLETNRFVKEAAN